MKQKQLVGAAAFLFLLICFACLFIEPGSGIWQEGLNEVQEKRWDTMVEVMQQMRKKDRAQVSAFMKVNADDLGNEEAMERFYSEVSTPMQGVCQTLKRVGGKWWPQWKAVDGDKFICFDHFNPNNCLIYSFGISNDWSFEDSMGKLNCTVHGHDPSVSYPAQRSNQVFFHKVGVGLRKGLMMDTLSNLLAANDHLFSQIFYLKVDIENAELGTLPQWIESGILQRVDQLGIELHLGEVHQDQRFPWLLGLLQQLYLQGFRIISHEVNTAVFSIPIKPLQQGYHSFLEVVLMRDTVWNHLDLKDPSTS